MTPAVFSQNPSSILCGEREKVRLYSGVLSGFPSSIFCFLFRIAGEQLPNNNELNSLYPVWATRNHCRHRFLPPNLACFCVVVCLLVSSTGICTCVEITSKVSQQLSERTRTKRACNRKGLRDVKDPSLYKRDIRVIFTVAGKWILLALAFDLGFKTDLPQKYVLK